MTISPLELCAFFDAAPDPYLVLDRRLHIAHANRAYLAAVGRGLDEIVGRWAWEAFPTDSETQRLAIASFERVFATGQTDRLDMRFDVADADGRMVERHWRLVHSPVPGPDGQVAFAIQHAVDVTARVRADRELMDQAARQDFREWLERRLRELADPSEMIGAAIALLGEHLGIAQIGFAEVEDDQAHAVVPADWTDGRIGSIVGRWRLDDFGPPLVADMRAGRTIVIPDLAGDARTRAPAVIAAFDAIGVRALLDVPLVKNGRMVAVMFSHHPEPHDWTPYEVALVEDTCERLWSAVQRARAESALRASEGRLLALARASSDVLYRMSPDWGEMKELHGGGFLADTSDPSRAWLMTYIPAAEQARVTAAIDTAIRDKAVFDLEHRVVKADGTVGWTRSRAVPILGADGGIVEWFGAAADVTARREAEDALRAGEARLRELNETLEQRVAQALAERKMLLDVIENADTLLIAADFDYRILAINRAGADGFERVYGVRIGPGDSLLAPLADRPEQQAAVRGFWSRALAGEEFSDIAEFGDPHREQRCFSIRFSVLRDPQGTPIGAYQLVQDVTDQRRERDRLAAAEAARRAADALYRAYFKNTAEALFVVQVAGDDDFVLEELNPAHEATTGLLTADVAGKRIHEFLSAEDAAAVGAHYRRCVASGEVQAYRETLDLPSGTLHWDTVLVPVRDDSGRVVRLVGSARDVTAQVLAAEALRQSQKLETIGQLTGGVAHDFNNLLTPIVATLDMLLRRNLGTERERRLIDAAAQSAERARVLVQRLLAFARRQPLQAVPVDAARLVAGMGDLVASTTGPQIRVVVDAPDGLPPALADANQVEMALLNLAVNARDAMPDGGTLRMSVGVETVGRQHRSQLPPGRYIRLSVADTGFGMDEETARRAIEPFFSTKGIGKGTGLGLSMAHGLASQLGGALTIQSRPGLGTNIEVWLPLAATPPAAPGPVAVPATVSARGTALLVDDEPLVRATTADMLADLGYAVIEADSAEAALRLLAAGESFGLLVTDHLMAGMSGSDLAVAVRAARPGVPVLLVSGYADDEGVAPDLPRLTKPFRRDELAAKLAELSPAVAA